MSSILPLLLALSVQPYEGAKDFEARDLAGNLVRLEDLEGKVVLLNFWGIWCKSCRQEIPHLSALYRERRENGLVVLGADYGDSAEDLAAFVRELEIRYPILVDDGLADVYEVLVYPTTVVIDRKGRVRRRVEGYREEAIEDMKSLVATLLEEE
jgi:peroxiredoxin